MSTTPSLFEQTGISINVYESLVLGGGFLRSITDIIESYEHEIDAFGGFISATFTIKDTLAALEDWQQSGIGRHIVIYGPGRKICWEGFVNRIAIRAGSLLATRGPLMAIANRVSTIYVPILDEAAVPPILGTRTETTIVEDTGSQEKYGIIERILSTGNALEADVDDAQTTYLAEHFEPETSNDISLGSGSDEVLVTLECRGYVDWLDIYVYNNTTSPTSTQATTKLQAVLAADPNAVISTDYSKLSTNALLVPSWEDENRKALDVIKSIVVLGGVYHDRWLFGIYDDRRAYYAIVPSTVGFRYYMTSQEQRIETVTEIPVDPWDMRPGYWVQMPDFLIGKTQPVNLRTDPRALFVETVHYTAPYSIQLSGGRQETLPQKLAFLGLSGMSS